MSIDYTECIQTELTGIVLSKEIIRNLYDDPTILSLVSSPSTFKKEMVHKDNLIGCGKNSIEEAHKYTKMVYKLNYPLTPFKQEFSHLLKYIYYTCLPEDVEEKPSKKLEQYWKNNEVFWKKSYIRVKLIKCGWNPLKIEELVYRHFPSYDKIPTEKQISVRYMLLKGYLRLPTVVQEKKTIGRPKCPQEIKHIIQLQINKKLSEGVRQNREVISKIKELFTVDNMEVIIRCLGEHPEIAEKCEWLKENIVHD